MASSTNIYRVCHGDTTPGDETSQNNAKSHEMTNDYKDQLLRTVMHSVSISWGANVYALTQQIDSTDESEEANSSKRNILRDESETDTAQMQYI